jgi:hypothetical protein
MKKLLTIACVMWATMSFAQNPEIYFSEKTELEPRKKVAKIEPDGKIVWVKDMLDFIEYNEEVGIFIIAAETTVRNGRIVANPSDYDYWIISDSIISDEVKVFPTLCSEYTTIHIASNSMNDYYCTVRNSLGEIVDLVELFYGHNHILTQRFPAGSYLLDITENKKHKETIKIVIAK